MENAVQKQSITYGIILGVILSLVTVILYVFLPQFYTSFALGLSLAVIIITFGIISSIKARKLHNGIISFKSAFRAYFIPVALGLLISTTISILIFVIIDPEAAEAINQKVIETSTEMMRKFGTPESEIEKQVAKMNENNQFNLISQLKGWFFQVAFYSLIGLLSSLAIKKENLN